MAAIFSLDSLGGSVCGGADGAAGVATFCDPEALIVRNDKLYIADRLGRTIRVYDFNTGLVSTIAGSFSVTGVADGIGAAASFYAPMSLEIIGNYLYVGDYSAHIIRRVDLTTQEVQTIMGLGYSYGFVDGIAGVGSATRLYYPYALTTDVTYLYICDSSNNAIRKYDPATMELSTWVGQGPSIAADRSSDFASATLEWPSTILWTPHGMFYSNDGLNVSWIH